MTCRQTHLSVAVQRTEHDRYCAPSEMLIGMQPSLTHECLHQSVSNMKGRSLTNAVEKHTLELGEMDPGHQSMEHLSILEGQGWQDGPEHQGANSMAVVKQDGCRAETTLAKATGLKPDWRQSIRAHLPFLRGLLGGSQASASHGPLNGEGKFGGSGENGDTGQGHTFHS